MIADGIHSREDAARPIYRLIVAATFTAEPVNDALAYWMEELDCAASIEFTPYNQIYQQLLDPGSLVAQNRRGVNIVLVRIEDWQRAHAGSASRERIAEHLARSATDLISAVQTAMVRSSTPLILAFCPSSAGALADRDLRDLLARLEQQVAAALGGTAGLAVIRSDDFGDLSVDAYDDPQRDQLGHIPYTRLFYAVLGTLLARRIQALLSPSYKVIVLDCDNTLWKGVVGEDGIAGITIPPAWRQIQQFMVELSGKGFLVCLCSKNAESDVLDVFEQRQDMILKRDHLVAWRINWLPKSANIRSLARELNLGLESFIFLDDNPVECAEVSAGCPEVLTLRLPVEGDMVGFLQRVWAFDRLHVTAEDQRRTAMYQQEIERGRFQEHARTIDEFLAGLNLCVGISELEAGQWHRIAQLTQRTNQFNFTTVRRTAGEIQTLLNTGRECRVVEVSDRFGDYGLVGVMIFAAQADALEIDTFLLSCRVLGRGVEYRMLNHLGEIALERGLSSITATLIPTRKNSPARDFLESVPSAFRQESEVGVRFAIAAVTAATVAYTPSAEPSQPEPGTGTIEQSSVEAGRPADSEGKSQRFERIAALTGSPEQVIDLLRARAGRRRSRPGLGIPYVEPQTTTEAVLAEIWADLLRLEPVGTHDNYFHLGGTSLLAVDLFAQIERRLGKKLPLTALVEAPSIEQLARLVAGSANRDSLVMLRPGGAKPPLFLVHDGDGETMLYRNLALLLKPEHAIFGLQPHSLENVPITHTRITDMASYYIERIRSFQRHGPYLLGGMCAGGVIAFEIARQLQRQGEKVALVALIDAADVMAQPRAWRSTSRRFHGFMSVFHHDRSVRFGRRVVSVFSVATRKAKNLTTYLLGQRLQQLRDNFRMKLFRFQLDRSRRLPRFLEQIPVRTVYLYAEKHYQPDSPFDGDLVLFRATQGEGSDEPYIERYEDPLLGWDRRSTRTVWAYDIPGGHSSMLQEPHVQALAQRFQLSIDEALADEPTPPSNSVPIESSWNSCQPVSTIYES